MLGKRTFVDATFALSQYNPLQWAIFVTVVPSECVMMHKLPMKVAKVPVEVIHLIKMSVNTISGV